MSKRPRVPGKRKRPAGKLHFRSNPPANASPAVLLGTELRMSAEIIDCCVCGAKAEHFEVLKWGPEPEVRKLDEPLQNGLTQTIFVHRSSCPVCARRSWQNQRCPRPDTRFRSSRQHREAPW
jgi:hypothetical protein